MPPVPPITKWLLIVNVAAFFIDDLLRRSTGIAFGDWLALWPLAHGFMPWQVVTYAFLHGDVVHLLFNMFALWMFGSDVERLFGSRFFTAYYFVSVLAAAISHLVVTTWMGAEPAPTVGASGGIYGVLLAYGLYFPHRRVMLLIPPIPMSARMLVIVYAALELFFGVTGTAAGVAHFAHLGGMLGGYLMIRYRRGFRS